MFSDQTARNRQAFAKSWVQIAINNDFIGRWQIIRNIEVAIGLLKIAEGDCKVTFERIREIMAQITAPHMGFQRRCVDVFVTKHNVLERFDRLTVGTRWNATVNKPLVVSIFIRQVQRSRRAKSHPQSRGEPKSITTVKITITFQLVAVEIHP